MNKVKAIASDLSEEQLRTCVRELKDLEETGVLSQEGEVRKLTLRLAAETGISGHDARTIAPTMILRAAAYKWAGL